MGWPAAIAAIVAAGGAYMQSEAANDAADRRKKALNEALAEQDAYAKQAENVALENADQYEANKRIERLTEAKQEAVDSLTQQLISARESTPSTAQTSGRLSKEFEAATNQSEADTLQSSLDLARLMGNMRGTNDMLTNEAYMNADYASDLGLIGRNASSTWNGAQPGIVAAGQVDSLQSGLGAGMSALGTSYLGSSMGKLFSATPTAGATAGSLGSGAYGIVGTPTNTFASGSLNTGFDLGSGLKIFG